MKKEKFDTGARKSALKPLAESNVSGRQLSLLHCNYLMCKEDDGGPGSFVWEKALWLFPVKASQC